MNTLRNIEQFDPNYRDQLERLMLEASPLLPVAERCLIGYLLTSAPFVDLDFEQCMKAVIKAIAVITPYEVAYYDLDEDGKESEIPSKVMKWDRQAIVRDRFGYLLRFNKNIVPA